MWLQNHIYMFLLISKLYSFKKHSKIFNFCNVRFLKLIYLWLLGASKSIYAPEPFDVGRILQVDIISNGQKLTLTTDPIQPGQFKLRIISIFFHYPYQLIRNYLLSHISYWCLNKYRRKANSFSVTVPALGSHVETLLRKSSTEFSVCY